MRITLSVLFVLLIAVLVAVFLHVDNGYALLSYHGWSAEMSLATLALLVVLGVVAILAIIRVVVLLWHFPSRLAELMRRRREQRARRALNRGLIDLAEGRWSDSEYQLTRYARYSDIPLINYLGAARAAQVQGAHERRDNYLKLAYEQDPSAHVAVLLTQAELQIAHRQYEHALATLQRLQELNPQHGYTLKLLARLYQALGDWDALHALIPRLRRYRSAETANIDRFELAATARLMEKAAATEDAEALQTLWSTLPRRLRQTPDAVRAYAQGLMRCKQHPAAEALVRDALRANWDEQLVLLYGRIRGDDLGRQLRRAEGWLNERGDSSVLLLTAGRLCVASQLWGKARSYLESSIAMGPRSDAYEELGRLLQALGEQEHAMQAFRDGLVIALGETVAPRPRSSWDSRTRTRPGLARVKKDD